MKSLNFNSKLAKPKKMHKKLLKQALSLFLVLLTLISAFPLSITNVYAWQSFIGKNSGGYSDIGNAVNGSDQWLKHLQLSGVQAYAYDTKNGQFIQGTYGDTTFKVIQFLGIDNIYNNVSSYENHGALYKTNDTSFGTVSASDVYRVDDYPFKMINDNGEEVTKPFYDASWGFTRNTSKIDSWLTAEVDGKESVHLANIITTYWGEAAYNKMVRNPNVVIVIEPMMLVEVQVSTDNDGDGSRRLHDNVSKEPEEVTVNRYTVGGIYDDGMSGDICSCGSGGGNLTVQKEDNYYLLEDIEDELHEQFPNGDETIWSYIENEKQNYYGSGLNHIEVFKDTTTEKVGGYNIDYYYNMLLATSRWVEENNKKGNKMQVYEKHNVPMWGLASMFADGIGKKNADGSYDTSKWDPMFVFPIGSETVDNLDGAKNAQDIPVYSWDGEHRALTYGGKRSTLGMVMYSPAGLFGGDYIHHTNNYSQSKPSAADSCAKHERSRQQLSLCNKSINM